MSSNDLGVDNSIPDDESGVAQLISHFVGLFESQQEQIEAQQKQIDSQQQQIDDLEDEVDELREHSAKDRADIRRDVAEVSETVDSLSDPHPSEGEDGGPESHSTPIERVQQLEEDQHGIDVNPSVRRATTLYEHLRDWAVKTPRGYVLKTKNNLKSLLSAATEESLKWKQVYRACEALDDLAKGGVEYHENNPRHGKMLVMPNDAQGQSSSAAT